MTTNLILLALAVMLAILLFWFLYLFLKKDQALLELKTKYEHLVQMESEHFKDSKQRDDYVAMMVHELRSPLSVIKGSADLLMREESALSSDQKFTLLTQVKESSTDLLDIVNDILDVSKIESGRFEVKKTKGNINKVLEEEAQYYMALAAEKEIEVKVELSDEVADLEFDEDRLKHVMNNLLSNALKFTENAGKVIVSTRKIDDNLVEVRVADSGIGIPENMKNKLFNKFVQMENKPNRKEKGTGLGLVIAKGIVEAHGGKIWVEDNQPKGAVFLFTLPLAKNS